MYRSHSRLYDGIACTRWNSASFEILFPYSNAARSISVGESKHYQNIRGIETLSPRTVNLFSSSSKTDTLFILWTYNCRRKCYFDSERKLRFLKVYTQRNCELECLSNATLNSCGCVKFSHPRDATTPICGSKNIECYQSVRDNLLIANITSTSVSRPCNCLPACNSITYDAEISQNPFDWNSFAKTLKVSKNESAEYKNCRVFFFRKSI